MHKKQQTLFTVAELCRVKGTSSTGYKGIYAFHKYWGKKPHEPLSFIIDLLSSADQVVLDPFVGSGTAGREALLLVQQLEINPS